MIERLKNNMGFSLIELMIVVAIISILASIAIPNVVIYRREGYHTTASTDLKNAYVAAHAYFSEHPSPSDFGLTQLVSMGYKQSDHINITISPENV